MIEYIVLGVCVLIFLGAIAFVVVAGLVKWLWKPAPVQHAPASKPMLNPEDRNLDFLRRKYPDPAVAPMPDLEEMHLSYHLKRDREDKIASIRKGLDVGRTPPATPPNA